MEDAAGGKVCHIAAFALIRYIIIYRQKVASFPGHSQVFLHSREIKSGKGLGMRLDKESVV